MSKSGKNRSKTSQAWLNEHVNDPYVHLAKKEGYRARAAYKLLEIDEKDQLLRAGMTIVDLGSAPGSWSQVVVRRLGATAQVFALDILPMEPIDGVHFICGDFREDEVLHALENAVGQHAIDLVISDIAPNMSGQAVTDQARSFYLAELALDFACNHLKTGGTFVVKVFQGAGFQEYVAAMRAVFAQVLIRKPKASRDRSNEVYLVGKDFQ
ncbi:MAG: 23S rRNA (uridine(2552)-2'-O)-methyltransferase RlmE [Neisseria sp.]|nr:23S rRNA (uridine(2552)-2'-O)-methyltransferase RlmE [Neisseria sp.]